MKECIWRCFEVVVADRISYQYQHSHLAVTTMARARRMMKRTLGRDWRLLRLGLSQVSKVDKDRVGRALVLWRNWGFLFGFIISWFCGSLPGRCLTGSVNSPPSRSGVAPSHMLLASAPPTSG